MNQPTRPITSPARIARWAVAALAFATITACGDDGDADPGDGPAVRDGGPSGTVQDAAPPSKRCGGDEDGGGIECDADRHCVDGQCMFNTCGDGVRAGGEECDDGNEITGDGCDPACKREPSARCGDAVTQPDDGEECDDGNLYDGDECSNACTENVCGNARIDGDEECDDGDAMDDNECSDLCTENRCRNGRLDVGEECDDGNRIHDDGCTNACMIVICGNGEQEGDEECDDGNQVDTDDCANACTANACGNQRVDPGEACDGDTVEYACADDCMSTESDACRPCEDMHCTTYQGADWVAGCFEGMPAVELVPEVDPLFAQHCIDAVNCARRTGCGYNPDLPVADCYCGSNAVGTVDACNIDGPADDAPCADEWRTATRAPTNIEVMQALADITVPSGWVYYLMECDRIHCSDVCVPN
jgi:cysteine-rich repeat protein